MDVRLPRLGEGADSGTIAGIFVKEGDQVKKEQPILELESEKAVATIPSPAAGTITKIHVKDGDEIRVGALLVSLSEEAGQEESPKSSQAAPDVAGGQGAAPPAVPAPTPKEPLEQFEELPVPAGPVAAAPSVRKTARELGIDLSKIRGSERGGRIVMADLKRYIQGLQRQAGSASPVALPVAAAERIDYSKWGTVNAKKITTLRRTISTRMVSSWTTIPHITQFDEADITGIMNLRKKYASRYEKRGARLTLTAFALKAIVPVLKKHPIFNSSFDEGAGEIVFKEYIHVGIAVDTEQGLIVPVLRDVDRKSLFDLATGLDDLAERTRQRKVPLEEMQGGSFTISNQGGIGSGHFTPIVNKPEVAILGMGRSVVKPVIRGKKTEPRTMLPLSLSYDHRVIDGADAARFMVDLVNAFETLKESEVKI